MINSETKLTCEDCVLLPEGGKIHEIIDGRKYGCIDPSAKASVGAQCPKKILISEWLPRVHAVPGEDPMQVEGSSGFEPCTRTPPGCRGG